MKEDWGESEGNGWREKSKGESEGKIIEEKKQFVRRTTS